MSSPTPFFHSSISGPHDFLKEPISSLDVSPFEKLIFSPAIPLFVSIAGRKLLHPGSKAFLTWANGVPTVPNPRSHVTTVSGDKWGNHTILEHVRYSKVQVCKRSNENREYGSGTIKSAWVHWFLPLKRTCTEITVRNYLSTDDRLLCLLLYSGIRMRKRVRWNTFEV